MKYSLLEQVIRHAFFLSVWCLEQCHDMAPYQQKVAALSQLPQGSVGQALAECLLARELTLVPGFESHDLKHVVLAYELEPVGEIRLQAFMLGNGNWTLPSLLIFLFGFVLLPQHWAVFRQDFQAGRQCLPLATLTIEDCQHQLLHELRSQLFNRYQEIKPLRQTTVHLRLSLLGSYGLMAVGIAAMLFCYPFLWSANLADLVGAGFPFVAGAILVVGGLLNLTLQAHLRAKEAN
ncbi:hypothetical protein K3G63_21820 [Hymenobacter sp. HSC-4F20]|uniref:hypothetical protein n=1 Tax=Hymenobacter sp. HSC-4F20 TaxID=2864135 RepID=UPI001C733572|nr:hypothetical protein [Hymenobacter sp. HSC-4F20]MBX0293098.1 hypothetical protein [Hymenobacter sp. HSC-4F20]